MKKICLLFCFCLSFLANAQRPVFDLNWGSYLGDGNYLIYDVASSSYNEGTFIAHSKFEWNNLVSNYNMNDKLYSYHYRFNFTNWPFFNVEVTAHGSSHGNDAVHNQDFIYYGEGFCLGQHCQFNINMEKGTLTEDFTFTERGLLRSARFKFVDEAGNLVKTIVWTENLLRTNDSYYDVEVGLPMPGDDFSPEVRSNQ